MTRLFIGALLALCGLSAAGEQVNLIELEQLPGEADSDEKAFLQKKQTQRQSVMDARKDLSEKLAKTIQDIKTKRAEVSKPGSATVTIDEETKDVPEPPTSEAALGIKQPVRDPYDVSPDDFQIFDHDRWSINLSDFRADAPQYIVTQQTVANTKAWFGFTFSITNPTPKKRRITPMATAITSKGVFNHAVGGFLPERMMADSMLRPLITSAELRDKELLNQRVAPLEPQAWLANYAYDVEKGAAELQPMSTFAAGQTRWGAALWSNFSNEFTQLKIIVHGLSNAHRYDEKMRRVLVLTYERNDDEFHVHRTALKLADKRWDYLWMWDQCITVPAPADAKDPQIKVQALKTPAGADKLAWAFPFVVQNPTRANQEFAINSVAFVCPVEVDVAGTKIAVETRVMDDGRSTIYKAQTLKALGKESPKDRFELNKTGTEGSKTQLQRRMITVDSGKNLDELWAVFDESDVDWDNVKLQVETALTEKVDKKALARQTWEQMAKAAAPDKPELAQKDPGFFYDPRRQLTEEEFKQVKEQVAKGLPAAIDAAKAKKTVVAYFDCTSGLSTGSYRVSRSYRQLGVIQEEWLKAWEELDKAPAAGGN